MEEQLRILITGSSGFIGSHLSRALAEKGYDVYGTCHINPCPSWVTSIPCDISKAGEVQDAVQQVMPHVVFHLASQPIVAAGEIASRYTYQTNVNGTFNLLDALEGCESLRLLVVASTDKVYGRGHVPYTEETPLLGNQQVYECTKTMADHLIQLYSKKFPTIITRCSNVYGPGDVHETRIIPHTILSYIRGDAPVIRSNGQLYRDYVYVSDVVQGYMDCLTYGLNVMKHGLDVFNFGTGQPSRVLDVVSMIRENFADSSTPVVEYGAADEIDKQYNAILHARTVLGWMPMVSLRDGIRKTIEWWKNV